MESLPAATAGAGDFQVVHSAGLTRIAHTPPGTRVARLFTAGGDDTFVRVLPADALAQDVDPLMIEDAQKPVTWVDADTDYLVTASEDGCVRIYQHSLSAAANPADVGSGPTDLVALLARSPLPARCAALEVALRPGKTPRVAVCTDDLTVKIVDAGSPQNVQLITGHTRSVRSASWCPTQPLLVTCSSDATARVWDLSTPDIPCVKVVEGVLASSRPESELACLAAWHPSGTYFVLPGKLNDLVVVACPSWTRTASFVSSADQAVPIATGEVSAMAFCPNGRFLAVATRDCRVTIWETSTRRAVRSRTAEALVTGLSWRSDADALAWSDTMGSLIRWDAVLGDAYPSPCERVALDEPQSRLRRDADSLFGGDDDDGDDDQRGAAGSRGLLDDEAGDEDDMRHRRRTASGKDAGDEGMGVDDLADFVVDDEDGLYGGGRHAASRSVAAAAPHRARRGRGAPAHGAYGGGGALATTRSQPTFQPTSTPMHAQRRYLAFNLLGSLTATEHDASHQTLAFESYDASARRNWRFTDHHGHSMAALGGTGALFACPERSATLASPEQASTVHFKPFEASSAWSVPGSEWTAQLLKGESAVAVALSGHVTPQGDEAGSAAAAAAAAQWSVHAAVVATSAGYVRIFSSSGLQRYVWSLGAPVVTLAAGARHLLVVSREACASAAEGFQNLSYTLMDLATFVVRQRGSVALPRDVTLTWAGLGDNDVPAVFDSRGVLSVLDRAYAGPGQARWVPMLDTRLVAARARSQHDRDDEEVDSSRGETAPRITFWPVSLGHTKLMTLMLRGQRNYPDPAAPSRPLVQELELELPLLQIDGGAAAKLEEEHLRSVLLSDTSRLVRRLRVAEVGEEATASLEAQEEDAASSTDAAPRPHLLDHAADKALLQLIQLACKLERHARVLDAARELHSGKTLDAALQIAAFFHLPSLAERMAALAPWVGARGARDANKAGSGASGPTTAEAAMLLPRVLVPSSPQLPAGASAGRAQHSSAAAARQALSRGFSASSTAGARRHAKSYGRRGLQGSHHGRGARDSSSPVAPAREWDEAFMDVDVGGGDDDDDDDTPMGGRENLAGRRIRHGADRHDDDVEDEGNADGTTSRRASPGAPSERATRTATAATAGDKRNASAAGLADAPGAGATSWDGETAGGARPRSRGSHSNPFASRPGGAVAKNPFARRATSSSSSSTTVGSTRGTVGAAGGGGAPGTMRRDRSLHKSTSFFERVDAVEAAAAESASSSSSARANGVGGAPKRSRQTVLEFAKRGAGEATTAAAAAAAAATPAFAPVETTTAPTATTHTARDAASAATGVVADEEEDGQELEAALARVRARQRQRLAQEDDGAADEEDPSSAVLRMLPQLEETQYGETVSSSTTTTTANKERGGAGATCVDVADEGFDLGGAGGARASSVVPPV